MRRNQNDFSIREVVIVIAIVIGVGVLGMYLHNAEQRKSNNNYFIALSSRTESYYTKQADALGVQSSRGDLVKRCYRTEQGPFDDGNLWCGISVTKKVSIQLAETRLQRLVKKLETVLKAQGFSLAVYGSRNNLLHGFSLDAGIRDGTDPKLCGARLEYNPYTAYPDAKTALNYELGCSNRASGVVHGFIDDSHNL